jgi:hypothetical protein
MSAHESFEKPASEQRENVNNDAFEPASTDDEVPELHIKTWLALAAMGVIQYTSLLALVSPSAAAGQHRLCISSRFEVAILGDQRGAAGPSRTGAFLLLHLRRVPSPQECYDRPDRPRLHRCSDCTRIARHLQAHWCLCTDRLWACGCAADLCCAQ